MSATHTPGSQLDHPATRGQLLPIARAAVRYGALVALAIILILVVLPAALSAAAASAV